MVAVNGAELRKFFTTGYEKMVNENLGLGIKHTKINYPKGSKPAQLGINYLEHIGDPGIAGTAKFGDVFTMSYGNNAVFELTPRNNCEPVAQGVMAKGSFLYNLVPEEAVDFILKVLGK